MVILGNVNEVFVIDYQVNMIVGIVYIVGKRCYLCLLGFGVGWVFGKYQVLICIVVGGILELVMGKEGLFDVC